MPYVSKNQYDLLLRDQETLLKLKPILLQSIQNPTAGGIGNIVDLAETAVSSVQELSKAKAEIARLTTALSRYKQLLECNEEKLKKSIQDSALEIEVNEDLASQLKDQQVLEDYIKCLQDEIDDLRASHRMLGEDVAAANNDVRRLKSALQAVLGCVK